MKTVSWSEEMSLGVPAMDDAHKVLVLELARLATAGDDQFEDGFFALIAALEVDFREEEQLMRQINFPNPERHHDEHARVLNGLLHVGPSVRMGDLAPGRDIIRQLPQWFLNHLRTMDLMLAVALDMAGASRRPPSSVFPRTERVRLLGDGID